MTDTQDTEHIHVPAPGVPERDLNVPQPPTQFEDIPAVMPKRKTPWTAIMVMIILVVAIATAGITYAVVDDGPEVNRLEDRIAASREANVDLRGDLDEAEAAKDAAQSRARAAEAEADRQYDVGWDDGYGAGVIDGTDSAGAIAVDGLASYLSTDQLLYLWGQAAPGSAMEQAIEDALASRGVFPPYGDV